MKESVPPQQTNTSDSRKTRDPHPALPDFVLATLDSSVVARPPPLEPYPTLDQDHVMNNPFLRGWVSGPAHPMHVPGTEVSMYRKGGSTTHVAGTAHAYPVWGALVHAMIMRPRTEVFPYGLYGPEVTTEQRKMALACLAPMLYNSAHNEIFDAQGEWSKPGATRREFKKAYGKETRELHNNLGWAAMYPAFPCEYAEPTALDVWVLKQRAEASMHYDLRCGRLVRAVLVNYKRQPRGDINRIFSNYCYLTSRKVAPGSGAPTKEMLVSAYNAYRFNMILGETPSQSYLDRHGGKLAHNTDVAPGTATVCAGDGTGAGTGTVMRGIEVCGTIQQQSFGTVTYEQYGTMGGGTALGTVGGNGTVYGTVYGNGNGTVVPRGVGDGGASSGPCIPVTEPFDPMSAFYAAEENIEIMSSTIARRGTRAAAGSGRRRATCGGGVDDDDSDDAGLDDDDEDEDDHDDEDEDEDSDDDHDHGDGDNKGGADMRLAAAIARGGPNNAPRTTRGTTGRTVTATPAGSGAGMRSVAAWDTAVHSLNATRGGSIVHDFAVRTIVSPAVPAKEK